MLFTYHTERLNINILSSDDAPMVLDFYLNNKEAFEAYEPLHDENFYTLDYQSYNLEAEMKLFFRNQRLRYYLIESGRNKGIIGTVSFTNILNQPAGSCNIGYRIGKNHQRKGYAAEALNFLIPVVMKEMNISRIEANILPTNIPSIKLIEALGFVYEGVARSSYEIRGSRMDHLRYSLIDTDLNIYTK